MFVLQCYYVCTAMLLCLYCNAIMFVLQCYNACTAMLLCLYCNAIMFVLQCYNACTAVIAYMYCIEIMLVLMCYDSVSPRSPKGHGKVFVKKGTFTWKGLFYAWAIAQSALWQWHAFATRTYWCMFHSTVLLSPALFSFPPLFLFSPNPKMNWYCQYYQ